ncbi:MAG: rhomboid family intramembrane serine protease [Thalassolituus sp.]|jgi:GlpG protein|uniref:rhomboid family intramembrane serine protease n=1 Tax=unclassified Thalassolituus TaxID=2624967 RepID=UPI000B654F6A|nr:MULTISPECIES: rhomboid family intramembrane serine protease [unclassified Thalassolituus]MBN57284.1 hypothetical protein [Oceanospirillaceae bacterium]MDQ4423944.1 rhomboid family intramembrane serine protease [Thalassolituus sp.]MDQ4426962.1 rhomboid family intramembrane serine protease [Thalassolituus sp.]OUX65945.1 MAG: hypothetical protein CBE36_04160 [Oceanospirillaceae bacterium TMED276]|tara:strand:+ start:1862 stop:2698 length:837 start_codon:yes stop_codon:yes gene_type:complete
MQPLAVLSAPLETDLSPLTRHLWSEKIVHRVVEEGNQQVLLIADPDDIDRIKELLDDWREGSLPEPEPVTTSGTSIVQRLAAVPLTVGLMLLVVGVFGWQHLSNDWHGWLENSQALWPDARNQLSTYLNMSFWEIWRPTLLHFSVMHLLFNSLWVWVLAGAMERQGERFGILALLILCGVSGNLLQWWLAGPAFGGISGVVYGLAAWTGLRQYRYKIQYGIPPALLGVMIFFMVIMLFGDTVVPGLSGSAHGGHLGGLLCGFLLAVIWPNPNRRNNES